MRRAGRSVRVVSQATGTPMATVPAATNAPRASVAAIAASVRGRARNSMADDSTPAARMTR